MGVWGEDARTVRVGEPKARERRRGAPPYQNTQRFGEVACTSHSQCFVKVYCLEVSSSTTSLAPVSIPFASSLTSSLCFRKVMHCYGHIEKCFK